MYENYQRNRLVLGSKQPETTFVPMMKVVFLVLSASFAVSAVVALIRLLG